MKKNIIERYAREGILIGGPVCSSGCKFCYEKYVSRIFPDLITETIQPYNEESFNWFYQIAKKSKRSIQVRGNFIWYEKKMHFIRNTDFFCLGLTEEQIEKIFELVYDKSYSFYTTGLETDISMIKRLTAKYDFNMRISVVTFNDILKKQLVLNFKSKKELLELIYTLKKPGLYFLHLNYEQTINDLELIKDLDCTITIALMDYNRFFPDKIRDIAQKGHQDFKKLIYYLAEYQDRYSKISLLSPPEAYAWKNRNKLYSLFEKYKIDKNDLILCSQAAFDMIKKIVPARVEAVQNQAGGSIKFMSALTSHAIISHLSHNNLIDVKNIYVPQNIWRINGIYDLNGDTINALRNHFPLQKIIPINVPLEMLLTRLTINECFDYYKNLI